MSVLPLFLTALFGIILLTACLNLIITSASSKWAILAPVFVPMLMAVGISPELTQAAFRGIKAEGGWGGTPVVLMVAAGFSVMAGVLSLFRPRGTKAA